MMKTVSVRQFCLVVLVMGLVFPGLCQDREDFYARGLALGRKGKFQPAEIEFKKAVERNPFSTAAARALELIEDLKQERVKAEAAVCLFAGMQAINRYSWNRAIVEFEKAVKKAPGYYYAHHNLGAAYYERGLNVKAIGELKRALALNSRYPYTYNNLGLAYNRENDYEKAVEFLEQAVSLDGRYYKAYNNLGVNYGAVGRYLRAVECFKAALEINPNYTLAFQNMEWHLSSYLQANEKPIDTLAKQSVRELGAMLNISGWEERYLVVLALGRKGDEESVPLLISLLADKHAMIRALGAKALRRFNSREVVRHLINALRDTDWNVRWEAADSLKWVGDRTAVKPLIGCLKDKDYHVAFNAAHALGVLKDRRAVKPLIAALKNSFPEIRRAAAQALGEIKDPRALAPLQDRLSDVNPAVKAAVEAALEKMKAGTEKHGKKHEELLEQSAAPANEFHPYEGKVVIKQDVEITQPVGERSTGLDGMSRKELFAFRLAKLEKYRQLNMFEPGYHPFRGRHRLIYGKITGGVGWLAPTTYYIANPCVLIVVTCANHVTPLNLSCPVVNIVYNNGVITERRSGTDAACWFERLFSSYDYPGLVCPAMVNAWDAGFLYMHVDLSRSVNIRASDDPANVTNCLRSSRYFYHVGRYGVNNISPTHKTDWLTLRERDVETRIYIKLWREKPGSIDQAGDMVYIVEVIP